MESHLSQDPLDALMPQSDLSLPATPELEHAEIPDDTTAVAHKLNSGRVGEATSSSMTPPPSTHIPSSSRNKTRTPTPPMSQISTPPPTIELPASSQDQMNNVAVGIVTSFDAAELEAATPEELRTKVTELHSALQETKMSAAHHKLQYQMLSQESAAAIDRMAVEARMAQTENDVIYLAEQARVAATPRPSVVQEGTIPVHKDLYQRMCRELQHLREANGSWKIECDAKDRYIERQEDEIASLTDKVTLMRERIRESREHLHRYRRQPNSSRPDTTPRSIFSTPQRGHIGHQQQQQPFAALLQASEMVSQESTGRGLPGKKGHTRNMHSTSSLPSTPQRMNKVLPPLFQTPSGRQAPLKVPATAPMPRTSALRTPNMYSQPALPMSKQSPVHEGHQSDGTVSASEPDDNDSEAETDIIETDEVGESRASLAASQMLRTSQEHQQAKRESFKGSGMLQSKGDKSRQTKLFGASRKANVQRDDGSPTKRARTGESGAVGLGIH